jgi:hypothetical protein
MVHTPVDLKDCGDGRDIECRVSEVEIMNLLRNIEMFGNSSRSIFIILT